MAFCLLPLRSPAAAPDCLDTGAALEFWRPLREQATEADLPADTLALELVGCLASPDPELRDRIGYELFTFWLRQGKLKDDTRAALLTNLQARLSESGEAAVLSRSFSALVLAELLRSDATSPFMSATEREQLLKAAAGALETETDFRGLDEQLGWVHPVAHTADLLWRFALHPATTRAQAELLLTAVRARVAPAEVAYAFNESDRLARVVSTLIRRELLEPAVVTEWLASFSRPQSGERWSSAFQSVAGMRELHNTKQFLRALSDQLAGDDIDAGIATELNELVGGFTLLI